MTKLVKRLKSKKGFTLVELIVVIAILAILAAILVPTMLGVLNDSRDAVAKANAKTVYSAAHATFVAKTANGTAIADGEYNSVDDNTEGSYMKAVLDDLGENFATTPITIKIEGQVVTQVTYTSNNKKYTYIASTGEVSDAPADAGGATSSVG